MGIGTVLGIISAIGSISSGQASKRQAEFQAAVNVQQAAREKQLAAGREEDFRRGVSASFAERRAAGGRAGIETGTGSALLAAKDFAAEAELQALRIRSGGEISATRLMQQAALTRAGGRAAQTRGFFRGGASLLTGFSDFGGSTPPPTYTDPRIGLF